LDAPPSPEPPATLYEPQPVRLPEHPVRATWALIAVNVAVFALESWWGGSQWSPVLYAMGANTGRSALAAEPWRLLSSAFLHIGPLHLAVNMWALSVFGRGLERLLGSARLLVLYGLSALGGGLVSALHHDERLAAGASGAVWGLMVAELVLLLYPRSLFEDLVFRVNKATVLQPLVLNIIISLQPGIDLLGHLGGGLAGALVMGSRLLSRRPGARAWRVAGAVSVAAMALGIGLAFAHGRPWELRAPRLAPRTLDDLGIRLMLPPGLPRVESREETVVLGRLEHDALVVECHLDRLPRAMDARAAEAMLLDVAREAAQAPVEEGLQRLEEPSLATVGARRAFHQALGAANGARVDSWYFVQDARGLRLDVTRLGGEPEAWSDAPQRIAASVTFLPAPPPR